MHPTSPGAFMLSATLHGVLAILALLFGYVTSQDEPRQKILELVAGEGDNFMAQEAPALGKSDGLKTNVPKVPEPKPAPVEPTPVAPPPSTPAPPTPKQTEQPVPNFAKDIKRTIIRAESQAKRDVKKEQEKEKKRADEEAKKLTKEEFSKLGDGLGGAFKDMGGKILEKLMERLKGKKKGDD